MFDTERYQQVLAWTTSWNLTDVMLDVESTEIHVRAEHPQDCRRNWPKCSRELACYDHAPERQWRHLNTCQIHTLVHARVPPVEGPDHGVVQVKVPSEEPHGTFTLLMERFVIDVLQACQNVKGACRLIRGTRDQAWRVFKRAVAHGLARKQATAIARIGVDEKAFRKGQRYLTIGNDVNRGTVEFAEEGREKARVAPLYDSRTPQQLAGIEAVAMDMWEPFVQATLEAVPLASSKIVFGRFHVMQHMTGAVDIVRRRENRLLIAEDDDRLKGTKYLWICSKQNVHPRRGAEFRFLRGSDLKSARGWAIKEPLWYLWSFRVERWARRFFSQWSGWAMRSRLEPSKAAARMIDRRLATIITHCRDQLTNAVAEGLNSQIMAIKRRAAGYRNVANFKEAIHFYCGGLRLSL